MLLTCARCGRPWEGETLPFRESCSGCRSWLHSCENCGSFRGGRCADPSAEPARDPGEGNWCEWFRAAPPRPARQGEVPSAREKAEALWKGLKKPQTPKENKR